MSEYSNLRDEGRRAGRGCGLRGLHARVRSLQGDERRAPFGHRAARGGGYACLDELARIDRTLDETKRIADELAEGVAAASRFERGAGLAGRARSPARVRGLYAQRRAVIFARPRDQGAVGRFRMQTAAILVPDETERTINSVLKNISPIRAIASVRQMTGSVYKKPFIHHRRRDRLGGGDRGAGRRPTRRRWPSCRSRPWSSTPCRRRRRALLDDGAVNIDEWIAEEVEQAPSPRRKARPSSPATAPTSRRASMHYTKVAEGLLGLGQASATIVDRRRRRLRGDEAPADKLIDLDLRAEGRLPPERARS